MHRILAFAAPFVASLVLVGCKPGAAPVAGFADVAVASPSGKTVVSAAAAGANLVQASHIVEMARALYVSSGKSSPAVVASAAKARDALAAAGQSLETSTATSGDLAANTKLAADSIRSALAGLGSVSGASAAQVQGYLDAFNSAVRLYNDQASVAGLPTVPVAVLSAVS